MAQRGIREYDAKALLHRLWTEYFGTTFTCPFQSVLVTSVEELEEAARKNDWLNTESLVIKPDMLFGERGKNNLVYFKKEKAGDD